VEIQIRHLGMFLRECRKQKGYGLKDLARQLRRDVQLLEGVEGDRYDDFGSEDELKNCLREYAEAVDLLPSAIVRLYQRQMRARDAAAEGKAGAAGEAASAATISLATPVPTYRPRRRRRSVWPVLTLVPLILAAAGFFWQSMLPHAPKGAPPVERQPVRREFSVVPPQGGQLRLVALRDTQVKLALDDRSLKEYPIHQGMSVRWQVRQRVAVSLDPHAVEVWFDERPIDPAGAGEILLLPQAERP